MRGHRSFSRAQEFDDWLDDRSPRVLLALVLASLLGVVAYTLVLRASEHEGAAYASAPICPSTVATACKSLIPVTVADKGTERAGKSTAYYIDLDSSSSDSGDAPAETRVDLPAPTALWNVAEPGYQATETVWNGIVVSLDIYGVSGDTADTPGQDVPTYELIVAAAVALTVMFALFACRAAGIGFGRSDMLEQVIPALEVWLVFVVLGLVLGSVVTNNQGALSDGVVTASVISAGGIVYVLFDAYRAR